ncbi:hypothetical protein PIB30_096508 [Stylosanthes scabra]|uniref:Uncharacterized protein n=1 Tax=Stylosanthes scabra TaxID=79078 RepID=A0ABU6QWL4_9FABA|nr:hypothetical protein [Stylosanthes scabra]
MEMQGIPVTMANLALHRQKEEEMNQERMRYDQILQEATAQQAKEANKGKAREVVPDSEEEFVSSESEECALMYLLVNFRVEGMEKSMRKAKKNIGSKDGLQGMEKACKSGDFTKEARVRSGEKEL